jgi:hypothetical protein
MEMIVIWTVILYVIIMLTSIPVGMLLAWLCSDEIVYRRWFYLLFFCFFFAYVFFFIFFRNASILLTLLYMMIITFMCIRKSLRTAGLKKLGKRKK